MQNFQIFYSKLSKLAKKNQKNETLRQFKKVGAGLFERKM